MEPLVHVDSLRKHYGATRAVDDVSFDIGPGEVVGLIGPNGAGKSTLLKSLLGLIHYQGELRVLGQSPRMNRARMLESLSYIADVASLPEWISVGRLLDFMEGVHPGFDRDLAMSYLARTEITPSHRVKALSKGMKTQLHLALIMGVDSRLLVLDEPTLGLDIIFRSEFYDSLASEYINPRRSILVTTHMVEEIEQYLTRVMFIHHGRILLNMERADIGRRFVRVSVGDDELADALRSAPIHVRSTGGRHALIFENRRPEDLQHLGDVGTPGLAELFVAKIKSEEGD